MHDRVTVTLGGVLLYYCPRCILDAPGNVLTLSNSSTTGPAALVGIERHIGSSHLLARYFVRANFIPGIVYVVREPQIGHSAFGSAAASS